VVAIGLYMLLEPTEADIKPLQTCLGKFNLNATVPYATATASHLQQLFFLIHKRKSIGRTRAPQLRNYVNAKNGQCFSS
jgi:hypothetical protein